jgi:hypothetical protein
MWVASGVPWFFGRPPAVWNPWVQLIDGGHSEAVPKLKNELITYADSITKRIDFLNQPVPLAT